MTKEESMDCNELVELVTAYLEGALDLDTRARFEVHLTECDGSDLSRATSAVVADESPRSGGWRSVR
jgi:hypothetical protein